MAEQRVVVSRFGARSATFVSGVVIAAVAASACGRPPKPSTAPATSAATVLPPVPLVDGPLAIRVVYPPAGATIQARDSNFIFGTVGSGKATLTINGTPVPVVPNGSFIAFLALPPASAPQYSMVASRGPDTVRTVHTIKLPPPRPVLADTGRLVVDSASVAPRGARLARADERIRVSVRAPRNASVEVHLADNSELRLVSPAATLDSLRVTPEGDPYLWATDAPASLLARGAELVLSRGRDSVRFPIRDITVDDTTRSRWVRLTGGADVPDTDRVIILRPVPNGTYKWLLLPGTTLQATGRIGDMVRVRLDAALEAWVAASDVTELPPGTPAPRRTAANARVVGGRDWVDVVIPTGERPAFEVREEANRLVLILYSVQANSDIIGYTADDSLVRRVRWY